MTNKNTLDNITGQEIKEMINDGKIAIEQLDASLLRKLMNHEIDMICFGEGDLELIDKCSDLLDELAPNPMSNEEFMNIIRKTEKERITVIEDDTSYKNVPKTRFILKRIAIVAAAVVILLASTVAVAAAFGVNVFEYIKEVVRLDGETIEADGITFYKSGFTKDYSSIYDLVEAENLDIVYPSVFPEGIFITKVKMDKALNGNDTIAIYTNDIDVGIEIEIGTQHVSTVNEEIYEYGGIEYYINQTQEGFVACCNYNENKYYISATNKQDLIYIINNIKEK